MAAEYDRTMKYPQPVFEKAFEVWWSLWCLKNHPHPPTTHTAPASSLPPPPVPCVSC